MFLFVLTNRSKQLIKDAIFENDFLKNLEQTQVREIVECMSQQTCQKGDIIIQEGEAGNALYVIAGNLPLPPQKAVWLLCISLQLALLTVEHVGTMVQRFYIMHNFVSCRRIGHPPKMNFWNPESSTKKFSLPCNA